MFTFLSVLRGTSPRRFSTQHGSDGTIGNMGQTSEGVVTGTKPEATRNFTGGPPGPPPAARALQAQPHSGHPPGRFLGRSRRFQ